MSLESNARNIWHKFKELPRVARVLILIVSACLVLFSLAACVITVLLLFFFGDDPKLFRNNAAVALEGGKVVIYQAELGAGGFASKPLAHRRFHVLDVEDAVYVWALEPAKKQNGGNMCPDDDLQKAMGIITYGTVPRCFSEEPIEGKSRHAIPLIIGRKYVLEQGDIQKDESAQNVYFILAPRSSSVGGVFLKTNSPATEEIKRSVMKALRE